VPTFMARGVSRGQRGGSPTAVNLSFIDLVLPNTRKKGRYEIHLHKPTAARAQWSGIMLQPVRSWIRDPMRQTISINLPK
jgi:hypothetical protein